MAITLLENTIENGKAELKVKVDGKEWIDAQDKAVLHLAKNITIKGFRKGTAPVAIAKKHVDPNKVLDASINEVINVVYNEGLKQAKLIPFLPGEPSLVAATLEELTLAFKIVLEPEITLGNYKDIVIDEPVGTVTDEEITAQLQEVAAKNGEISIVEKPAIEGNIVDIDFVGSIDKVDFPGGSAKNHELKLGSHTFIPGFEEQLIGSKADSDVIVTVTFPEDYQAEGLAGKVAEFRVHVNAVKEEKLPPIDDELALASEIPGIATLQGLKSYFGETLKEQKRLRAENAAFGKLVEAIEENTKIVIIDEIIETEFNAHLEAYKKNLEDEGSTLEKTLESQKLTFEEYHENMKKNIAHELRHVLIQEKIIEAEKIKVSDADVDKIVKMYASHYGVTEEIIRKEIRKEELLRQTRFEAFKRYLLANNKAIKE